MTRHFLLLFFLNLSLLTGFLRWQTVYAETKTVTTKEVQNPGAASYALSSSVHRKNIPFIEHTKKTAFGSYLAMNINYEPMPDLVRQIENQLGVKLKTRGEAHITTITPPEYDRVLKEYISINDINQIAKESEIQSSSFEIVCLGQGRVSEKSTYFIIVQSENLLKIRREVAKQFAANGGQPSDFDAEQFYPHITLGFTHRDLHLSDGVVKDRSACIAPIIAKTMDEKIAEKEHTTPSTNDTDQRIACRQVLDKMHENLVKTATDAGPQCIAAAYQGAKVGLLFKCGMGTTTQLWKIRDEGIKKAKKICKGLPQAKKCQGGLQELETCRDQVWKVTSDRV